MQILEKYKLIFLKLYFGLFGNLFLFYYYICETKQNIGKYLEHEKCLQHRECIMFFCNLKIH